MRATASRHWCRLRIFAAGALFTGCLLGGPSAGLAADRSGGNTSPASPAGLQNVARGRPYTLTPRPNYSHCTDAHDRTQLTDGVYTRGYFWTQASTVGWRLGPPAIVRIDLGRQQPICGLSWSTAAGVAGVSWPEALFVFVSPDGSAWFEVGNLVALSTRREKPPADAYATHVFRTEALRTRGRYVAVAAVAQGAYVFCDEIEVFRGPDAFLGNPPGGRPVAGPQQAIQTLQVTREVQEQLARDLAAVRADLVDSHAASKAAPDLLKRADALAAQVESLPPVQAEGFRAVLPMTDLERAIFRLQATVWRTRDEPLLRIWHAHRWDPLAPSSEPPPDAGAPALRIDAMQNECRADVVNLSNASDADLAVRIRTTGLPGGPNPKWLDVCEVAHTGTRHFTAVAAALPPAKRAGEAHVVTVPSGMTRQVWFSAHTRGLKPADYHGEIVLETGSQNTVRVPLHLKVWPLRMPDAKTLGLGGWSYTNRQGSYGVTPENRDAFVAYLRSRHVSTPWATSGALPHGRYDNEGNLVEKPDTADFDAWVRLWPGAARYLVFASVGSRGSDRSSFAGSPVGTPLFTKKVSAWVRFWAGHVRDLDLEPGQLGLLLVDEPHSAAGYGVIRAWADVIHRAAPDVVVWEDPTPRSWDGFDAMAKACDVVVPNRGQWLTRDEAFRNRFRALRDAGTALGFYSCAGPARCFDPFSYYLAQAWHCFGEGGTWMGFWAFGDNGRASCWNEYMATGNGPYCPLYIDAASVTPAKYMEAVAEGVQDYEYLVMLRKRVATLKQAGKPSPLLTQAEALLARAVGRVLAGEDGPNYHWDVAKDRAVADRVRVEILETLAAP